MFAALARAFRPLDTSAVEAAIAEATEAHQGVRVRARALRRDVYCGEAAWFVRFARTRATKAAGKALRRMFDAAAEVPADMQELLDQI